MLFEEIIANLQWSIISEEKIYGCIEIQQELDKISAEEIEVSSNILIVPFYICKNARMELYEYQINIHKGLIKKEYLKKYFDSLLMSVQIKKDITEYLGEFFYNKLGFSVY